MTREWARQELDMEILEKLYDMKSLRGTTLAKLCTPYNLQKTHDRVNALKKNGTIESKPYIEITPPSRNGKPGVATKKGAMNYLTGLGVKAVKEYRGLPVQDYEQGIEVTDKQLKSLFTASIIVENIRLPFEDGRKYKQDNNLANYITIDLICGDWLIFVERNQTSQYRKKICHIVKGIRERKNFGPVMVVCPTESLATITARAWKDQLGPDARFMSRTNMQGIEKLLKDSTPAEVITSVATHKGQVIELPRPENGYTHKVNGEPIMIKDLIGFSPQIMRQVTSSLDVGKKKYIVVERMAQLPYIANRFPELLNPDHEFITLDGAHEMSEGIAKLYGKKRRKQLCES